MGQSAVLCCLIARVEWDGGVGPNTLRLPVAHVIDATLCKIISQVHLHRKQELVGAFNHLEKY